jgi:CheY-like chemotaxis protein
VDGPSSSPAPRERRLGGITVLVVEDHDDSRDALCRARTLAAGFEDHLLKPVDGETVVRTVARVVAAARRMHASS